MSYFKAKTILVLLFILTACDFKNTIGIAEDDAGSDSSTRVVYFPDGGGVELPRPFIEEFDSGSVRHKIFIINNDINSLRKSLISVMELQGYNLQGAINLQGFKEGVSFAKPDSVKRVNFRLKEVESFNGDRVMLRISWSLK